MARNTAATPQRARLASEVGGPETPIGRVKRACEALDRASLAFPVLSIPGMPGHSVTFERRRIGQGTASDQTASSHGGLVAEERPSSATRRAPHILWKGVSALTPPASRDRAQ
jgi:hypothetical protein